MMKDFWVRCIETAQQGLSGVPDEYAVHVSRMLDKNDENAKALWKILARQAVIKDTLESDIKENGAIKYIRFCCVILKEWRTQPALTPKEHRKNLLLVAKKARELRALLIDDRLPDPTFEDHVKAGFRYGFTPAYQALHRDNYLHFHGRVGDDSDVFGGDEWVEDRVRRDAFFRKSLNKSKRQQNHLLDLLREDNIVGAIDFLIERSEFLSSLPLVVKQPRASNPHVLYFVRQLHGYHMYVFETPLWESLALAANICFDLQQPLDASSIRPWFKDYLEEKV